MTKRCKILFLMSRFLDGGIDSVLIDYLKLLAQYKEYQITLAIALDMGALEVFAGQVPQNIKTVHLVKQEYLLKWRREKITHRLPLLKKIGDEVFLNPIRRFIIQREINLLARENDIIIDFDCCAYSYLHHTDKKKIAWFHFSFDQNMKQNKRRTMRIGRRLESYDQVVTISKAMCEEGRTLFPRLDQKFCVIYNAKNRNQLLLRANEPTHDPRTEQAYILAVERLEESQKDITTLLYAYQMLRERYHHQELLYLLGKGQSEKQLRQLAQTLGIEASVVFLGFSENPYPWIQNARLLVHSSKFEGLPTVLLEGLMLDKLMVSTDCPTGPREILDDGRAGLLVPVGDAPKMAKAMHRILTEKELQDSIMQHAVQHRKHFMQEEALRQFHEIIKEANN